jgi:hypothetical protein
MDISRLADVDDAARARLERYRRASAEIRAIELGDASPTGVAEG